ncbi:MAG: hypothetical protein U0269_38035 [Polyangiales bacterium]
MVDRIRFKIRARDGRFRCDAVAEWRELDVACHLLVVELVRHDGFVVTLDVAASACGITRREPEVQLRLCAIYAQRARELDPSTKPTAWIACGEVASEARVIEGRLVA